MKKLLSQIAAAILGLWLATMFVPGVVVRLYPSSNFFGFPLTSLWQVFLVLGIALGLLNYFTKIFLKTLYLPLEFIFLGALSIIAGSGFLWLFSLIFNELFISVVISILYTAIIIWLLDLLISTFI